MTFEQYGALYGGDVRAIVAAAVIDGKLVIVLRFGTESQVLEPIARANVEAEMDICRFLHPDTKKQFFGDPDFFEELVSTAASTSGQEDENAAGALPSVAEEDDEIAVGFAVLVDGKVVYCFVCQHDIISVSKLAKANIEYVGPYILGIPYQDRARENPILRLAVQAACEWTGGGPVQSCYFLSNSQSADQLKGLGVVGEKIEVPFRFGRKRRKYAVLTFQSFAT